MMDEIELQLCLSIDQVVSRSIQPPHRLPNKACKPIHNDEKQKKETRQTKRPAGNIKNGSDSVSGDSEVSLGLSPSDSIKCGDVCDRKSHERGLCEREREFYLRLPPRKRARTLSFSSLRGQIRSPVNNGPDVAAVDINGMETMKSAPVSRPAFGSVHEGQQDLPCAGNNTGTRKTEMDAGMDIEDYGHAGANTVHPIPPQSQSTDLVFQRPPPLVNFPMGAYTPALVNSLPFPQVEPNHHPRRFSIYEDPDGMDIDGVGYLETNWCLSPEDDKENAEEEDDAQEHEQGHDDINEHQHEQDHGYHLPFAEPEQAPYNPSAATEQRAYRNNTTVSLSSRISSARTGQQNSPQDFNRPQSEPRQFANTQAHTGQDDARQFPQSSDMPAPALSSIPISTPSRTGTGTNTPNHPLPTPNSLTATEVSLRALPGQTSEIHDHTHNEQEENPRPRRRRRIIRSVYFV